MTLQFDPEYAEGMAAWTSVIEGIEPLPLGDIINRRVVFESVLDQVVDRLPMPANVTIRDFEIVVDAGSKIMLRWYTKDGVNPGSGIYFIHGGGMIMNHVAHFDRSVSRYVSESGVPFLSVAYRKAPEFPAPYPFEDCYAGLTWFTKNAEKLGVDPNRIAIMGESAGGGLAAGVTMMARDRNGPKLCQQILIYPMLDDRNTKPQKHLEPFISWSYVDNATGWSALLGESSGGSDVSPYFAPARIKDASGLPPLYMDTAELDIFLIEDLHYAQKFASAGVGTEIHVYPGVPHAWEFFCPEISVTQQARNNRIRAMKSI